MRVCTIKTSLSVQPNSFVGKQLFVISDECGWPMTAGSRLSVGVWCVGVIRMGFAKIIEIESKSFSLVKDGDFLVITERS